MHPFIYVQPCMLFADFNTCFNYFIKKNILPTIGEDKVKRNVETRVPLCSAILKYKLI